MIFIDVDVKYGGEFCEVYPKQLLIMRGATGRERSLGVCMCVSVSVLCLVSTFLFFECDSRSL